MIAAKATMVTSGVVLAAGIPISDMIPAGEKLAQLTASGILGVMCVIFALTIMRLFSLHQKSMETHAERNRILLVETTKITQSATDAMKDMATVAAQCRAKQA